MSNMEYGFGTLANETHEARLAREAQQVDHDAWMRAQAPNPLIMPILERLDAIEAALEMSHRDREEYSQNDLPWRHELVQRAATEIDHPIALETTIKGRCFREGMATMLVWLWDHPQAVAELAERPEEDG